jgi:hypothetical protein
MRTNRFVLAALIPTAIVLASCHTVMDSQLAEEDKFCGHAPVIPDKRAAIHAAWLDSEDTWWGEDYWQQTMYAQLIATEASSAEDDAILSTWEVRPDPQVQQNYRLRKGFPPPASTIWSIARCDGEITNRTIIFYSGLGWIPVGPAPVPTTKLSLPDSSITQSTFALEPVQIAPDP